MPTTVPTLLIAEVYCHDDGTGSSAAYVRIDNAGTTKAELTGHALVWNGAVLEFPPGASLPPEGNLCVAWEAAGYQAALARPPHFSVRPAPGYAVLAPKSGPPAALTPTGGYIGLLDPQGRPLDSVAWGDAPAVPGWTGPNLPPPGPVNLLQRAIDEPTLTGSGLGRWVTPGGTAAAWRQGSDWMPRRMARLGQERFPSPACTAGSATAFTSPDCAFAVVKQFLDGAKSHLDINLYEFTQEALVPVVEAALQRKVHVRLLLEGEPTEGMPESDRANIARLQAAGVEARVLRPGVNGFKRYHFDHAKYTIADGQHCLIMSDNWSKDSTPAQPQTGLRGWGVVLDSPDLAAYLTSVFAFDWNPASPDSLLFDPASKGNSMGTATLGRQSPLPIDQPFQPTAIAGPLTVTPFLAPQHALLATHAICGLLRTATKSLQIQQMSAPFFWGNGTGASVESTPNLLLQEVVAAARRGVTVRLLMDGSFIQPGATRDNAATQRWLADLVASERLSIEARLVDYAATHMGVHNKGVIADDRYVLISSINWTENSGSSNRELGLVLDSPALATYFGTIYQYDWDHGR